MIRFKKSCGILVLSFLFLFLTTFPSLAYPDECQDRFQRNSLEQPIDRLATFLERNNDPTNSFRYFYDSWYPQKSPYRAPDVNLDLIYPPSRAMIQIKANSTSDTHPVTPDDIYEYVSSLKTSEEHLFFSSGLNHILNYLLILERNSNASKFALENIFIYIAEILRQDMVRIKRHEELLPRVVNLIPYFKLLLSKRKHELEVVRQMIYNFPHIQPTYSIDIHQIKDLFTAIYTQFLTPASKYCSAVAVSHNAVLTAAHCVIHMKSVSFQDRSGKKYESTFVLYNNNYVDSTSVNYDIAVVRFPDNTFKDYLSVDLELPKYLEKVAILAYEDHGQIKRIAVISMPYNKPNKLSTNAIFNTIHGNSGAPLVNSSDKVTALVSAKVTTLLPAFNKSIVETRYAPIQVNEYFLREAMKRSPGLIIEGMDPN